MSLDGKLLSRAKLRLEAKKRDNEALQAKRLEEVYARCPRVRALDLALKASVMDVIGLALRGDGDPAEAVDAIRDKNLALQAERIQALTAAGFPGDYLDHEYLCNTCHDTGYAGTELCSCLRDLYLEEQRASLSSLFKLGSETFDSFDLSWYDDTPDPATGVSPRYKMEFIYDTCVDYATRFPRRSTNLFLSGGTGLGKTFLSACIARVVADKGFSVVYDTAASIFSKFEEEKFYKGGDLTATRDELRRYLDCDLLIMDDLGTEMTTSFTVSALYELVNSRLIAGRKTIISSNLSAGELYGRYSPQIASRIEGEYHVLNFCGRDIRLLKKGF
ncbi:DNA replication protein DnaC [Sporobacter termitidis DSM 10068]|uniref:DNA replication protein DnaC n=1 Tax=Sporobacter termitidis DSM 10068 TaxID=1123282 RepID=A0A1M5VN97_9FIRM|nr:ATP-binding protein [Sporobacter termitidis]SHH76707.1 DNA replication protein DnaC [Sporobacter termitidis DSM 10068]